MKEHTNEKKGPRMETERMSIFVKLQKIDSRYVYLLLLLSLVIPNLVPLGLPIQISQGTRTVYNSIETLPAGSKVLFACDISSQSIAETGPLCIAFLNHLASKPVKIYAVTFTETESAQLLQTWVIPRSDIRGKKYGEDIVNLGFYAGSETSMAAFASNVPNLAKRDYFGTSTDSIPMMKGVSTAKDFDLLVLVGVSDSFPQYLRQFYAPYKTKVVGGTQAVLYTVWLPFVSGGQAVGILNGLVGAAQYELLIKNPGIGVSSADALSASTILILCFVALGNVGYFSKLMKPKKE